MEKPTENVKQIFMLKKEIKELSKATDPTEESTKAQIESLNAQIESNKNRFNEEDKKSLEYWESMKYLEDNFLG